ncbi:MAG: DUF1800 domain-containing protein [Holophagales bacterium]|nr:DUF1800 domain-containing protein [Holophagales bacterium]
MSDPSLPTALRLDRRRFLGGAAAGTGAAVAASAALTPAAAGGLGLGSGPAMRPRFRRIPREKSLPAPPPAAIIALNRMGFGPRPGDVPAFDALGGNDADRMAAYVAQQLDPDSIDDSLLDTRLAQANFAVYGSLGDPDAYLARLWDWYINDNAPGGNTSSHIPKDELIRAKLIRAIYSNRQLVEVLAEFWHDHFNVNIEDSSFVRATLPHMDLVLRLNLLGRFRDMLEAVAKSTAMLYYLDNYTSSNSGPNENFCRELFELHCLGTENYLGVLPQNQVPTDGMGRPVAYVDADVFEATRAFTGWSFSNGTSSDGDTGLFYYRPEWHDRFQKTVLGVFLPQDQPDMKDGHDVLDALASHPGTGRYIARKLCRRLISDDPPQTVIDAAAAVFTNQWQAADQLKQVYETILGSTEFRTTWAEKIKRPFHLAVSALRATNSSFSPKMDDSDTSSFLSRFDDTGHEPFHWPAPDGFPDLREAWKSMTPMVMSWRLMGWLIDFDNSSNQLYLNILGQTPAGVRTPTEVADFWIYRILNRPMAAEDRQEILDFVAQGINPDFDLDFGDEDTTDRVRSMAALIMMSPDFLWR